MSVLVDVTEQQQVCLPAVAPPPLLKGPCAPTHVFCRPFPNSKAFSIYPHGCLAVCIIDSVVASGEPSSLSYGA